MIENTDKICGAETVKIPSVVIDLPPEFCHYQDEGCEYFVSCLRCPFSSCLFDEPGGRRRWLQLVRDKEIQKLHEKGLKAKELAAMFDISLRTVTRALRKSD